MLTSRTNLLALAFVVCAAATVMAEDGIATVKGTITVRGQPLASGRIFFHFEDDQFVGAKVKEGSFAVNRVPAGRYRVSIEGKGVSAQYTSEERTPLVIEVTKAAPAGAYDLQLK